MRYIVGVGLMVLVIFIQLSFLYPKGSGLYAEETKYDMALKAYVKKDFKTAVALLKEYVGETPDAKAYWLLGYASYKLKNEEESAGYFKSAYLMEPQFNPGSILNAVIQNSSDIQ